MMLIIEFIFKRFYECIEHTTYSNKLRRKVVEIFVS